MTEIYIQFRCAHYRLYMETHQYTSWLTHTATCTRFSAPDPHEEEGEASPSTMGSGGGLELLSTDFAKTLQHEISLLLHRGQRSIPGFLSHVTADLLSTQTSYTHLM